MIQLIFNKRPIRNDRLISNSYTVVRIQEGRPGVPEKGMNGEPESLETGRKGKRTGRKEGKQEKMCPETSESESE